MRCIAGFILLAACSFHASIEPGAQGGADAQGHVTTAEAGAVTIDAATPDTVVASACSTTGLTCLTGATATTCNGACWVHCNDGANEFDAAGRCTGWGGALAPLRSSADEQCAAVASQAQWTGYTQAVVVGGDTDEDWSWNGDGAPSPYLHWAAGQPNDGDGFEDASENCAYLSTSGSWQDTSCLSVFQFSCRR